MADDEPQTFDIARLIGSMATGKAEVYLKEARLGLDEAGWTAFSAAGAAAHVCGDLELTELLAGDPGKHVSYSTQQFVTKAMPECDLELDGLLALITASASREENGKTPYWMISAVEKWLGFDTGKLTLLLDAICDDRAPAELMHVTLAIGLKIDRPRFLQVGIDLLAGADAEERQIASNVFGQAADLSPTDLATVVEALQDALRTARGVDVGPPLRALLATAIREPRHSPIGIAALEEVQGRTDVHVREAIAMEMMFGAAKADPTLGRIALPMLHGTGEDETPTIEGIDHILSENLSGPLAVEAEALADAMLTGRIATLKRLDSYEYRLRSDPGGALPRTVTRWLAADQLPLHAAVRDLSLGVLDDPMTFDLDFASAGLSARRTVSIARRSCGVLMLTPESASSIIVSLMKTGPAEAIPALAAILWDPLLISYWTGPRKYLEAVLPSLRGQAAGAIRDVIARLDRYSAAVEDARDIVELQPSQHHRYLFALKRHREQLKMQKRAQEGSVLASLFPMSIMLFGDSAVYEMETGSGEPVRQENRLGTQEYSHELPRLDVIDPFGTWYRRARMINMRDDG